jgi:dTDP-4-amino-4,6-dideoxygalactose transaminase
LINYPNFAPWPYFSEEEASIIKSVLLSNKVNYWTGYEVREFEKEFANWTGSKYAIAVANGTLALDLALKALDVGPGDDVIVTPRTFIASVSCVVNVGARPIFADIDRDSGNITAETISRVITKQTKAIICVHLAGWPCDMDPIMDLALKSGIKVIEDCAQSHGAKYKGKSVGTIGHIGAWSFCQDKIITTGGEGGMVTTQDDYLWRRMWAFKDHGKSYEAVYERKHKSGFKWLHESFGSNYRMLEIQAALGRYQLKQIENWSWLRTQNAQYILTALKDYKLIRAPQFRCTKSCDNQECAEKNSCKHAYYKCYLYVNPENLKSNWSRDRIIDEINSLGVPCLQGSCSEIYLEKAFDGRDFKPTERLVTARELGETSLAFLVHPSLKRESLDIAISAISNVLEKATNINTS